MKTIDNSQIHLPPAVIKALEDGETLQFIVEMAPVALIVPSGFPASKRPFGLAKGEFTVPEDFNNSLPELEDEIYEIPHSVRGPSAP